MNTSQSHTTTPATRRTGQDHDCGCGCGCGGSGADGTAGSRPAPSGFRAGGQVRPVFFAGQLLTEDDLDRLIGWTAARFRAHNRLRYVSGDGLGAVLCGLAVSCGCDRGTVRIGVGHAVDGSGNDIPVSCPETVDVVALAREFRAAGGGCPDPCPPGPERTYGLYLRYDEEFTEPTAPYDPGDGCTPVACVPTRVREGHRFAVGLLPDPGSASGGICDLLRRRLGEDRAMLESLREGAEQPPSADDMLGWLLPQLDTNGDLCDRTITEGLRNLPPRSDGNRVRENTARWEAMYGLVTAYLRGVLRSLLVVECPSGCVPDVLIAEVTLDGCDVVRAVPAGRRAAHLPDPVEQQWRTRLSGLYANGAGPPDPLVFLLELLELTGCRLGPAEGA
ncbi:hypothetical protein [Streptomyces sp. Tu102]|uniref:hypothetical protein n=1 Tax=Streptomyces sp. Tu102 TaxID=2838019 RepID=UPI001BDCF05A|nr:hypothetical protein [Streptomyces sp. Tu102]MBT1093474.1 hypothetical protein [Streptomyces sp. Tu102]